MTKEKLEEFMRHIDCANSSVEAKETAKSLLRSLPESTVPPLMSSSCNYPATSCINFSWNLTTPNEFMMATLQVMKDGSLTYNCSSTGIVSLDKMESFRITPSIDGVLNDMSNIVNEHVRKKDLIL